MVFGWLGLMLMLLHFPNGELHPPVAAPWIYGLLVLNLIMLNLNFLSTAIFEIPSQMANPYALLAIEPISAPILVLAIPLYTPFLAMVLVSPLFRYRKSSYRERLQIKWMALFAGAFILYVVLGLIIYPVLTGGQMMNPGNSLFALFFYIAVGLFPPCAIGVAVLRHRLWDLDLIIRRTLVYSTLTVVLTLVYFGSVTLFQNVFTTASRQQSPTAVVLSTLVIAALFTPLRKGIQERIDRRFYRKKYDAEQVLSTFSSILREEVDLDYLTSSIQGVVEATLQPVHVSLWLLRAGRRNQTLSPEAKNEDTSIH
jgi:hypothetical protein